MEIKINGQIADITIDNEKTVGEIMIGLEQWLCGCGHRLSGLIIDGKETTPSLLEEVFSMEIENIKTLDVQTSNEAQLAQMSLLNLLGDIDQFENLDFEEKNFFFTQWKESAQAVFAQRQMPDLYNFFCAAFSNTGYDCKTLKLITEERIREVENPCSELEKIDHLVTETCAMLVDLPLDIQTGKDVKASKTIGVFSGLTEKIIRIFYQLSIQGYMQETEIISNLIKDFNASVRELNQAYETGDTVLVGDLAEYEMAPRLQELYTLIADNIKKSTVGDR